MVEETQQEEKKEDKVLSPIEETRQMLEEIKKNNQEMKENIAKLEELRAVDMLSGSANAGQSYKKKDETPSEYKDRVMRGEFHD